MTRRGAPSAPPPMLVGGMGGSVGMVLAASSLLSMLTPRHYALGGLIRLGAGLSLDNLQASFRGEPASVVRLDEAMDGRSLDSVSISLDGYEQHVHARSQHLRRARNEELAEAKRRGDATTRSIIQAAEAKRARRRAHRVRSS